MKPIKHGTLRAYQTYGCRCQECKKADHEHRKTANVDLGNVVVRYKPLIGNASVECRQDWIALYGD